MTGEKIYTEGLKTYSQSNVTFGDGTRRKIKDIGKLVYLGLHSLDAVPLVKGLAANLISISQLCDHSLKVEFKKYECSVTSKDHEVIMKGSLSKDNCYMWIISHPKTSLKDGTKMMHLKLKNNEDFKMTNISQMMLQYHSTPMSLRPRHVGNIGEINETLCVKNGNEELMIIKSYGTLYHMLGYVVQHVNLEVMMRLRKEVSKLLKC